MTEISRIGVFANSAEHKRWQDALHLVDRLRKATYPPVSIIDSQVEDIKAGINGLHPQWRWDRPLLIAVGGDGSLSRLVNAVMELGLADKVVVSCLPVGTGNDWARSLGITVDGLIAAAADNRTRMVDLIEVRADQLHYAVGNASLNLPVRADGRVGRRSRGKLRGALHIFWRLLVQKPLARSGASDSLGAISWHNTGSFFVKDAFHESPDDGTVGQWRISPGLAGLISVADVVWHDPRKLEQVDRQVLTVHISTSLQIDGDPHPLAAGTKVMMRVKHQVLEILAT